MKFSNVLMLLATILCILLVSFDLFAVQPEFYNEYTVDATNDEIQLCYDLDADHTCDAGFESNFKFTSVSVCNDLEGAVNDIFVDRQNIVATVHTAVNNLSEFTSIRLRPTDCVFWDLREGMSKFGAVCEAGQTCTVSVYATVSNK